MKTIKLILIVCIAVNLQSCAKTGDIQVQNNITQVKLVDVKWGDIYIATELLPGETSEKLTIEKHEEKLPSSQKISFKMTANNKTIYLETEEIYLLDEEDDLLIVLTDDTKVKKSERLVLGFWGQIFRSCSYYNPRSSVYVVLCGLF